MNYTREQIKATIESKNYKWFEGGDYNLNIVGIRNSNTLGKVTNKFDDLITVSYSITGVKKFQSFGATTDPGAFYEQNLLNDDGVAILVPSQYRSTYKIDLHQGKYEALCQRKPVKVYRDDNRDSVYDFNEDTIQEGYFGINIHRATSITHGESTQVDKWSAGCQVIASNDDYNLFMALVNKSSEIYGNSFTYTLIESKDIL